MNRITRYLGPLLLSATLLASAVTTGCAVRGETRLRIYDGDHRDWHDWDDREEHEYRIYLGEQHRDYRDFHRLNGREKSEYWSWRHNHSDSNRP
jgi:hypothetical protein